MRRRRILLLFTLIACGSSECRLDPSPSCSYRPERPTADGGVEGFADEIASVSAGDVHACAFLSTGDDVFGGEERRPRCWGGNPHDQLSRVASPAIGELWWFDDWDDELAFLDLGAAHGCALDLDDPGDPTELRCWGNNEGAQLGIASDEEVPGLVVTEFESLFGTATTGFAAGGLHTCISARDLVACMGDDRWDQLGRFEGECCELDFADGGEWLTLQPYDRIDLDAGTRHTCALLRETDVEVGSLFCWGDHSLGQLGPGGVNDAPGRFFRISESVRAFATGPHHGCAIDEARAVRCWGRNDRGELGAEGPVDELVRVPLPVDAAQVFAGGESGLDFGGDLDVVTPGAAHSCALSEGGEAWCWGDNAAGQLGIPPGDEPRAPVATHPDLRFRELALGGRFTCGITLDEELLCWGDNSLGQLGRRGESSHEPTLADVFRESPTPAGE